MAKKYLDYNGLQYFWSKIKEKLNMKQDKINDLSKIRDGALLGSTALQSAPVEVTIGSTPDEDAVLWIEPDGDVTAPIYAPNTAQVGQTIVVSAVDENGRPTAWEAVDMPQGGGGGGGGVVIIEINSDTGEPSIPKNEIDSLARSGVMVYAKIEEATIPMVCDGVYGEMEFFGFVTASFDGGGQLNYAGAYDARWEESTNNFIVNKGWSEFGFIIV